MVLFFFVILFYDKLDFLHSFVETGSGMSYEQVVIDDADDFIYMITPEQINQANGDNNGMPQGIIP